MKSLRLVFALAAIIGAQVAFAQPQSTAPASASPTRLRAVYRDSDVMLSWECSEDAPGGFAIYRSLEEISRTSLDRATRIGTAGPRDRGFIDRPLDRDPYFFAVFSLTAKAEPVLVFQPGKNTTARAVVVEPSIENPIENLKASAIDDSIRLTFRSAQGSGPLVLYRGTGPFSDAASLLEAVLVASFEDAGTPFIDYPVPGIDYWYALLREADLKAGRIVFRSGANATSRSVQIPAGLYRLGLPALPSLPRTPPLPAFALAPLNGGSLGQSHAELSAETEKAIAQMLALYPRIKPQAPVIAVLPEEKRKPTGGEDYALAVIVQGSLLRGDYAAAVEQLTKYLSLNRGSAAAARGRFYLGEALARTGDYRHAFFEFLRARPFYAVESRPWLDYLMAELRRL